MTSSELTIPVSGGAGHLAGIHVVPQAARGVIIFAHGSGSGRFSPRNQAVAGVLQKHGFATLLLDLLTVEEESRDRETGEFRFDIALLAARLGETADWLAKNTARRLRSAFFGASTGAAAALVCAADKPARAFAVVSRGGRPDLAAGALRTVRAPTLLIVGSADPVVLELNRKALAQLPGTKELTIIPGATHLFEEPGALERVAELSARWFEAHSRLAS